MLVNSYTAINFSKCNIYSDYIFLKGKKIKNKLFFKNFVYSLDKTVFVWSNVSFKVCLTVIQKPVLNYIQNLPKKKKNYIQNFPYHSSDFNSSQGRNKDFHTI